jgi:hypothetical protein
MANFLRYPATAMQATRGRGCIVLLLVVVIIIIGLTAIRGPWPSSEASAS